jgi:hypothetical protein
MKNNRFGGCLMALLVVGTAGRAMADDVHAIETLPGYQCMSLAKVWNGQGAMPPPVHVYAGPEANAAQVGIAGGAVIVPAPLHPVDGRTQMIFADGRTVWIGTSDIAPWHVASNPHATCSPVLLSNGRYGFATKH